MICPLCRCLRSRYHEHHGPFARWKPGMETVIVNRQYPQPRNVSLDGVKIIEKDKT